MAKLIQFKDNHGNVYPKIQRQICMIYPSGRPHLNQTTSWVNVVIPMDSAVIVGTKLVRNGNGILIGSGVSKIKISGIVCLWNINGWQTNSSIAINDSIVGFAVDYSTARNQISLGVPEKIYNVKQGDLITLKAGLEGNTGQFDVLGDVGNGTWLTVEVIE